MPADLMIAMPDYYRQNKEAHTFAEFTDLFDARDHGPLGLWEFASLETLPTKDAKAIMRDRAVKKALAQRKTNDPQASNVRLGNDDYNITRDGKVTRLLRRAWCPNVITDQGATAMLKNTWNNAGSTIGIMNQIAIDTAGGSTQLTSALVSGTSYTSLPCNATPVGSSIASGASVVIGYGTGQTQTVTTSGITTAGSTSIAVTSFMANANYAIGQYVVQVPTTSDNPSSLAGTTSYSGALSSGAFAFSGTGAGNRQVVISYTFAAGGTAGAFNQSWTTNANPVVAGATASHIIDVGKVINASTSLALTVTEKS